MATEIENETKYTPGQRAYSVHLLKLPERDCGCLHRAR